jgi:hypothetical protein
MKASFFIAAVLLASTAQAQEYYKADPAKLAELEAQRCAKISKEQNLIQRRLTGNNQPYDVRKMQDKQKLLQADYAKYCAPKATP